MPPRLAVVKTPIWDETGPEAREAIQELASHLGEHAEEFALPESAREAWTWHGIVMEAEMAAGLAAEYEKGRDRLSESLRKQLERGRTHTAFDYQRALARIPQVTNGLDPIFDRYDAILTPAAPGTAPQGLESTGSPRFCTLWTFAGMPALNVPVLQGDSGLPLGVQLVGRRGDDTRLLRLARWLVARLDAQAQAGS